MSRHRCRQLHREILDCVMRRRIDEPVAQHLEDEGVDFLQFSFRCSVIFL